ncbi:MAG TPA: YpdA family putative bacillithiol disulfide reductase [Terriglobia bacterium]|nr:YpdA family putative bacillithiol disulfide reductase [Terriglobia bacterium]
MPEIIDAIVVGAGPTGLACGIEVVRSGLTLLILEKGCLVNSLFSYPPGMTFFTSRERLEIGDLPLPSLNVKPTRAEALEYYRRVADYFRLPIHYQERVVVASSKAGTFRVETEDAWHRRCSYTARNVILATGYYDLPNIMGIPGEDLAKVSHYYGEAHAFYRRKVAVIGGANSAAVAALDLWRHGAEVTLIHRERELSSHIKYWIRPDIANRIKDGSIRALLGCRVKEIAPGAVTVERETGETLFVPNDFVFALTGYHPDFDLIRSTGVEVDPATMRPTCNPETLESNVPGLYLAGVIIAGLDTNEIFIENGRFHGKQIVGDILRKGSQALEEEAARS